jgi:PIN domain nuclease of toxin-antitoxin system
LPETIDLQTSKNGIQLLSIELSHILQLSDLPNLHRDPFDRLLIAQAQAESMIFLTRDSQIQQYDVSTIW